MHTITSGDSPLHVSGTVRRPTAHEATSTKKALKNYLRSMIHHYTNRIDIISKQTPLHIIRSTLPRIVSHVQTRPTFPITEAKQPMYMPTQTGPSSKRCHQPTMRYRTTVRRPCNKRCDSSGTTTASNSPEYVL